MRVGIDLDGCVVDFVDSFRQRLLNWEIGYKPEDLPEPNQWDMWHPWGMSKEEWIDHFNSAIGEGVFLDAKPYPGAIEALRMLAETDHSIHIITHRPGATAQRHTVQWLEGHGVPHTSLTFSDDKTIVPCDVLIEDNIDNAIAVQATGCKVFLMYRPWNDSQTEVPFVVNWFDFVAEVEHLQAQRNGDSLNMRLFDTGATRDADDGKLDYEGFYSPLVVKRFAEYMHANRVQSDGGLRSADNWQKGIPVDAYMKSLWRHMHDVWMTHRGYDAAAAIDESLCGVLFNAQGFLYELLRKDDNRPKGK